jgi:dihydrofolate reductase
LRKVILYVAASVDGYLARQSGDISWLPVPAADQDYGYKDFYASIHTLLIGRKTYEQALTFDKFPYTDKETFVFASSDINQIAPTVRRVSEEAEKFVRTLKQNQGGAIWLVGGAQLIGSLLEGELVDEIYLFLIPTLLGDGIRLFSNTKHEHHLRFEGIRSYPDGVAELRYTVNHP